MARVRVPDVEEAERQINQLFNDRDAMLERLGHVESLLSTAATPLWRRIVFRLDGWGPWWQNRSEPRWRPWRRWGTS